MEDDFYIVDLGDEEAFVWSFESPQQLFDYLVDLFGEHSIIEIDAIKQAFLNQERHFYYMECIRFEEIYLKHD